MAAEPAAAGMQAAVEAAAGRTAAAVGGQTAVAVEERTAVAVEAGGEQAGDQSDHPGHRHERIPAEQFVPL